MLTLCIQFPALENLHRFFLIVFTLLKMLYIFGQDNLGCFREDAAHVQMLSPQHVKTAIDHLGYSGNLR